VEGRCRSRRRLVQVARERLDLPQVFAGDERGAERAPPLLHVHAAARGDAEEAQLGGVPEDEVAVAIQALNRARHDALVALVPLAAPEREAQAPAQQVLDAGARRRIRHLLCLCVALWFVLAVLAVRQRTGFNQAPLSLHRSQRWEKAEPWTVRYGAMLASASDSK